MWPLFLLFLCCSWTPLLTCYTIIILVLDHLIQKINLVIIYRRNSDIADLQNALNTATTYSEWKAAALALDARDPSAAAWKTENASPIYRWEGVLRRVEDLERLLAARDVDNLSWRLGQFPVRHYCNITDPRLFARLRVGTKTLIERFVEGNVRAVKMLAEFPCEESSYLTNAIKLDALRAPRTATGKTGCSDTEELTYSIAALLLQAGGVFALYHLGVVKELILHNLLPRIIVGNQSAASVAALVGALTDDEVLALLDHEILNLVEHSSSSDSDYNESWFKRVLRLLFTGFPSQHENVLADTVRTRIGNITFEEAYYRTRKVLNITVASGKTPGVPSLFNHLTTPEVVIWTAVLASSELDQGHAMLKMRVKDTTGALNPWNLEAGIQQQKNETGSGRQIDSSPPLARMREFFNVNHFIVSQARPYLLCLLPPSFKHIHYPIRPDQTWVEGAVGLLLKEFKHRIRQAKRVGIAPQTVLRFLDDELMEEMTVRKQRKDADLIESVTLLPELGMADFQEVLHNPTAIHSARWILRGQRSVWPAISALKVRCGIEAAYEDYYQKLKTEIPYDGESTPVLTPKSQYRHDPFDDPRDIPLTLEGQSQNGDRIKIRSRRSRSAGSF